MRLSSTNPGFNLAPVTMNTMPTQSFPVSRARTRRFLGGCLLSIPRSSLASGVLASTLLLGAGSSAWAADKLVTVFDPRVTGTVLPEQQTRLDNAVSDAFRELQYQVIPNGERDTMLSGEGIQSCVKEECQERIGRLLGAQAVLSYQLTVTGGDAGAAKSDGASGKKARKTGGKEAKDADAGGTASWKFNVTLFNIEVGAVGATTSGECNSCTASAAGQTLADLVKKSVLEDAARPRGSLEILSEPSNASVYLDGHELGVTPYKRVAFAGKHEITVRKTGHRSKQETVTVAEAQKNSVTVQLQTGQDDYYVITTERQSRPMWRKIVGPVLAVGGAAALGFGAWGLSLNGACVETPADPMLHCSKVFDTQGIGAGLVGAGAAFMLIGIGLAAWPGEEVQVKRPVAGDPNKGKTPATAPAPMAPTPAKKSAGARLRHAGVNILPGGAFATVLGTF